jgi:hypothetical protein
MINLHLIWPVTSQQEAAYISRAFSMKAEAHGNTPNGRCSQIFCEQGMAYVISMADWDGSPKWHGVLAHELLHAVEMTFTERGLKHTSDTGEAWCYLMESLTRRCLTMLCESQRKNKLRKIKNRG